MDSSKLQVLYSNVLEFADCFLLHDLSQVGKSTFVILMNL